MVDLEYEIDSYKLHIFSRQPESEKPVLAIITLWKNEELQGYIHFYPNDIQLPNPTYEKDRPGKPIRLRFHIAAFSAIREILESEKPLFIKYTSPPPVGLLRSGLEPIGEEEKLFLPK
ncbi:MAG: hypothetical protein ACTSQI_16685 [Candidatus Helarchaeota archaeon]